MKDKSPFQQLSVPEYVRTFQDILLPIAKLTNFERYLIEGTYESIVSGNYKVDQLKTIENTSRVAYMIMHKGALKSFEAIAEPFLLNSERASRSLSRGWKRRKDAFEEANIEKRVLAFLSFYKTLYEGILPVLFAPIIASMAIVGGKKSVKAYRIDQEGKVPLSLMERIPYEWTSQKKQLSLGLNSHLRNSYAHECYRFLDGGNFELWDIDPRSGDYSWGPIVYTEDMLIEECEALWRNALSLVNAWVLFSANNRVILEQGKYYDNFPIAFDPPLKEDIKDISEKVLSGRGFDIIFFQFENEQLILEIRCQLKGVDGDVNMFVTSGRHVRKFVVKKKYLEMPIIDQLMGAFHIIWQQINQHFEFITTVLSVDNSNIGKVHGHTKQFEKYEGKTWPSISEFRRELIIDTLGMSTTWMLDESFPKEIKGIRDVEGIGDVVG